jgi:OOP family OmpA-OmpF porin
MAFEEVLHLQGDTVFDRSSAALKDGGKQEIDELLADLKKRAVRVGAFIVSGHTDRLEAAGGNKALSEQRAVAVKDYLVSKGADQKLIFWEGKGANVPVPVTKFCAS